MFKIFKKYTHSSTRTITNIYGDAINRNEGECYDTL